MGTQAKIKSTSVSRYPTDLTDPVKVLPILLTQNLFFLIKLAKNKIDTVFYDFFPGDAENSIIFRYSHPTTITRVALKKHPHIKTSIELLKIV